MRRLLIVFGILLLLPKPAFAATKMVLVHKITYYVCYSAIECWFDYAEEEHQEVNSAAQLVSTDQVVRSCTSYPCMKEVEVWYNWAVCYGGICPVSEPVGPVPLTAPAPEAPPR